MLVNMGVAARILRPLRSSSTLTCFLARWKWPGGCTQIQSTFMPANSVLKYLSKSDHTARLPPLPDLNSSGNSATEMSGNRPGVIPGEAKPMSAIPPVTMSTWSAALPSVLPG